MNSWNSLDNKYLRGRDRESFSPSETYEVRTLRDHLKAAFPQKRDDEIDKAISFVATHMKAAISQDQAKAVAGMFLTNGADVAVAYVYVKNIGK